MTLFENNADGLDRRDTADSDLFADRDEVTGIFDTIIYVGKYQKKEKNLIWHLVGNSSILYS